MLYLWVILLLKKVVIIKYFMKKCYICDRLRNFPFSAFIRVNEGTTGVFRVYDDVTLHLNILDELHKYKMKLTQIKCDQKYDSTGTVNK